MIAEHRHSLGSSTRLDTPPDFRQRINQAVDVSIAVERCRRQAQPLAAERHGWVVDRLYVDALVRQQLVGARAPGARGAGDVARAARTGTDSVDGLVHRGPHLGMPAHAEIVVRAPDRDVAPELVVIRAGNAPSCRSSSANTRYRPSVSRRGRPRVPEPSKSVGRASRRDCRGLFYTAADAGDGALFGGAPAFERRIEKGACRAARF